MRPGSPSDLNVMRIKVIAGRWKTLYKRRPKNSPYFHAAADSSVMRYGFLAYRARVWFIDDETAGRIASGRRV